MGKRCHSQQLCNHKSLVTITGTYRHSEIQLFKLLFPRSRRRTEFRRAGCMALPGGRSGAQPLLLNKTTLKTIHNHLTVPQQNRWLVPIKTSFSGLNSNCVVTTQQTTQGFATEQRVTQQQRNGKRIEACLDPSQGANRRLSWGCQVQGHGNPGEHQPDPKEHSEERRFREQHTV